MKPDVSEMQKSMAESLGVVSGGGGGGVCSSFTNTTNTLTPTTLRNITQLFESDECLQSLRKFEETGGFVPPTVPPTTISSSSSCNVPSPLTIITTVSGGSFSGGSSSSGKTYANLDCKSWQGGFTTVVTPSTIGPDSFSGSLSPPSDDSRYSPEPTAAAPMRKSSRRVATRASSNASSSNSKSSASRTTKRTGGRKPATYKSDDDLDPEETKRIHQRRQRNKEAAARCRKRRVDMTNQLLDEVDSWESKKRAMEDEIRQLKGEKEELEFILQAHSHSCKFGGGVPATVSPAPVAPAAHTATTTASTSSAPVNMNLVVAVKSEPVIVEPANAPYILPERVQFVEESMDSQDSSLNLLDQSSAKPSRPMSLSLSAKPVQRVVHEGVVIETPSSIIPSLGFDSVSTGLTPLTSAPFAGLLTTTTPTLNTPTNCSSQQRSSSMTTSLAADTGSPTDYLLL